MLEILVTTGTGAGPTPLAAFDAALLDAGVANYNLIRLSAGIPPNSAVQRVRYVTPWEEYGYLLYVVMARQEAHHVGQTAWAGLAWTQEKQTGRGLFAEAQGRDRPSVERDLRATLEAMRATRPLAYGPIETAVTGVECRGEPVSAVVVAVYRAVAWESG